MGDTDQKSFFIGRTRSKVLRSRSSKTLVRDRDKGQRTRLQFEATNSGLNQPNVAINEKEVFGSRIATRAVIIIDIGGRVRRLLEQPSWEEIKKKNN